MNSNVLVFTAVAGTVVILAAGAIVISPVLAQSSATSTDTVVEQTAALDSANAAPTQSENEAVAESVVQADTESVALTYEPFSFEVEPVEPAPEGLTEVNIIGKEYTDYFSNGSTITSYPGDPEIGAHLGEANAPTPSRDGLTWVNTTSQYVYDSASGELEEGQYALQPNGTYIVNTDSSQFSDATSTPETAN